MGARGHGLGYTSATLSDVWALNNNIAGLAEAGKTSAAFSYHAVPSIGFFNRMAAVLSTPVKKGATGLGLFRFGDDLYNEQVLTLGFANKFGLASLGLKINYLQYRGAGLENRSAFTVSFGGIAELTPHLFLGAYIDNVNQPVINAQTEERVPTKLSAGISFRPSEKLMLNAEIEKDLEYAPLLKSGIEYRVFDKVSFRTGFILQPQAGFFGLGFRTGKFDLDYAFQLSHYAGASHQATVGYKFNQP